MCSNKLYAQEESQCDSVPYKCKWDLRDSIYTDIAVLKDNDARVYGVSSTGFKDVNYMLTKDNCDQANDSCSGDPNILKYNVYYPEYHDYAGCKLPCVIIFHGGAFTECSNFNTPQIREIANEFAERGYVVFDVEYRRGVITDNNLTVSGSGPLVTYTSAQQQLAIYRAAQDARGAIRSIIKRQQKHDDDFPGDPYQIDINNIFIGGISAGSLIAMLTAYYPRQTMIDSIFPGVKNVLGDIDADYYYGNPNYDYLPKIKGVMNMWGGMSLPLNFVNNPQNFFAGNGHIPSLISFAGDNDETFYPDSQYIYFAPPGGSKGFLSSEARCLVQNGPYILPDNGATVKDLYAIGSRYIHKFLTAISVPSELYIDCDMEHGLDETDGPTFDSDFGTGYHTENETLRYMVQRTTTYFQAVMKGIAGSLGTKHFTECENYRRKCNTDDNHCGTPNPSCN